MQVAIGLDVGGTKILALAVDPATHTTMARREVPTPVGDAELASVLSRLVAEVRAEAPDGELVAVGVGIPGFIGLDGVARQAPNLPAAIGVDLRPRLEADSGVGVVVDNDANCASWAARQLDAPDADVLVAVTLGTGIGGGLVVGGELVRGSHGFAGEPGHMIVAVDGWECRCGQRGCWEMYASGNGLGRLARAAVEAGAGASLTQAAAGGVLDGHVVGRLVAQGDPQAIAVLDTYARWVSLGLVALINVLDPEVVVLGGGVAALGEALRSRVDAALDGFPTVRTGRDVSLRISSVGPDAGAIGAALLAAKRVPGGDPRRR